MKSQPSINTLWLRAHNLPNHAHIPPWYFLAPHYSKAWRIAGIVLLCVVWAMIGFALGSFNQAYHELYRWEQVRSQLLIPPKGLVPPERTIPELGIRVMWLEWDKYKPDKHIAVEDIR